MNRGSSAGLTLAVLAAAAGLAAFGIGLFNGSLGARSVLIALGTSALLIFAWQGWREERDDSDELASYLPLAVLLVAPAVYVGLTLFAESNDNDVLQDVIELAENSCSDAVSPSELVRVDVIEVGGNAIAVFNPPRGNPDDVDLPAFAERAVDSQTGELRPTSVLCMSYAERSGPKWCTERTYLLRRVDSQNTLEGSASATPMGDYDTVNSERFCQFAIPEGSSDLMVDVIEAAAAADQPLESFVRQ